MSKIGIFAGTFDPVHHGHITFAHAAIAQAGLNAVVFLPERAPRRKTRVSSFEHRVQMLQLATKNQPNLQVLTLGERQFTVAATLPQLQQRFKNDQLVLLVGSDVAAGLSAWQDLPQLAASVGIAVGLRSGEHEQTMRDRLNVVDVPLRLQFVHGNADHAAVTATDVRSGKLHLTAPTVRDYIMQHQLYGATA